MYGGKQMPYCLTHDVKTLNKEFVNYLNFGGYPEVILSEKIQSDMSRYVKNDIVDKVLLRDLPSLYGIKDVQELNRFSPTLPTTPATNFHMKPCPKKVESKKILLKNI